MKARYLGAQRDRRLVAPPRRVQGGCMKIADAAVLVTGANRGIGRALVTER